MCRPKSRAFAPPAVAVAALFSTFFVFAAADAAANGTAPDAPRDRAVTTADAPKFNGWAGPKPVVPCTCRPPGGGKLPVGAEICVTRGGEEVTLRCEMSLNMTIWKPVRDGCQTQPLS